LALEPRINTVAETTHGQVWHGQDKRE